jgi:hypothetical protein
MKHHTSHGKLNLETHRAPVSVWDRRGWDGTREQLTIMRWLVGLGGGALALQGIRQRSIAGGILAGLGGSLAWWALTGEGDLSEVGRMAGRFADRVGLRPEDEVTAASADSFPASDAPSWTPTVGTTPRRAARTR